MTAPVQWNRHVKRLERFREFYEEYNHIGLLKFLSEQTGFRRNQICAIAKGKRGAVPETIDALELAQKEFLKKSRKKYWQA